MADEQFDLEKFVKAVHAGGISGEVPVALVQEIDDLRFVVSALRRAVEPQTAREAYAAAAYMRLLAAKLKREEKCQRVLDMQAELNLWLAAEIGRDHKDWPQIKELERLESEAQL